MSNLRWAWPSDEVGHLATITNPVNSEDAQFPAARLCDFSNEYDTVPAMATASGAVTWLLAFDAPTRIDWIVLWHNFAAGVDVRFKMGDTSGTSDLDAAVVIPARRPSPSGNGFTVKVHKDLRDVDGFSEAGYLYAALELPASAIAAGAKLLCYSRARTLSGLNFLQGARLGDVQQRLVMRTDFGKRWAYDLASARRPFLCTVKPKDSDLADLRDWFHAAGSAPFGLVPNPAVNEALIAYWADGNDGLITSRFDPTVQRFGAQLHSIDLAFDELTSGLPEWE